MIFFYNESMKKRAHLILLFFTFFVGLFSFGCHGKQADYPIYQGAETRLLAEVSETYPRSYANGTRFTTEGITVCFDGTALSQDAYYFTMDKAFPRENKIEKDAQFSSSEREQKVSFYAVYDTVEMVYVSNPIEVTVTNDKAVSKWLYITGTAVLFVAAGIWFFIRYKKK